MPGYQARADQLWRILPEQKGQLKLLVPDQTGFPMMMIALLSANHGPL
jgi:hypothetical protein